VILLASSSPRRAEILTSLGIAFRVAPSTVEEIIRDEETAPEAVERLAEEKAREVASRHPGMPVLGADTVVFLDSEVLGKPRDDDDARRMLERLSGRTHRVATGVCLIAGDRCDARREISEVTFAPLSREEIEWYVSSGEPRGKAGAYAVQGLAARFVEDVRGSYSNVVGLPARTVYLMLRDMGLESLALPERSP
jgi:septum formation protein